VLTAWCPSTLIVAFLVLTAWVVLTGALHLDGFCDLCDGLFGGRTPEDRLRIMQIRTWAPLAWPGACCCCWASSCSCTS